MATRKKAAAKKAAPGAAKAAPSKFEHETDFVSTTEPIVIVTGKSRQMGYYIRYNTDVNAKHMTEKKGNGYFVDKDFVKITEPVTNWYTADELVKLAEAKPAKAEPAKAEHTQPE